LQIVTSAGAPIVGATVTLTPLDPDWLSSAGSWPALDWDVLEAKTQSTVSDDDGRLALVRPPSQSSPFVLWATHLGHRAGNLRLDGASPLSLPTQIVLEEKGGIAVRVLGPDGSAVEAATVIELLDLSLQTMSLEGRTPTVGADGIDPALAERLAL